MILTNIVMRKLIIILSVISLCCSCKTIKYVTQVQHDTLTVYKNNNTFQHDSIYVWKDHIIYEKGDTVYDKVVEYKDRWKIKEVHDTTFKERIVYQEKEIPVETEKPLTKIQKLFLNFGKLFIILLLIGLGYGGFKLYKKYKI